MKQKGTPIQRKLMRVIMMACAAVLLLTCAAFFVYEFITYRDIAKRELTTIGEIIAANSTASLAFDSREDADEILSSLKAEEHIVAAALYDKNGKLFAFYPEILSAKDVPATVHFQGFIFNNKVLEGFQPVTENNNILGTLYLRSNMGAVYNRFQLYGIIGISFIVISILFAYFISKRLQLSISTPILELAHTAEVVSEQRDYSVRAVKKSNDEVGVLTDAFNHMLMQIQLQSREIRALNASLEEKVNLRTRELQDANKALTQKNEFIQTIIDSSIDLIAVFNKNLEYVIVNKKAEELYRVQKDDMIGKSIVDVFPKVKGSAMLNNLETAFRGEFVHHEVYKSVVSSRYFENFFVPLKDQDGNTDRVMVIGHDITNIMQANEKLKQLNTELEKSNRDLEQFAYVASHDLQEPLRKIQIFSELSERSIEKGEILKRYLEKINSSAARMGELIQAVLNYSKVSMTDKEFSEIDLETIVRNIKTDLELVIEEKKATIITSRLPVIWGNALQIHQLFLNLISNSLKFSDKPPEISITANTVSADQAGGNGIPKSQGNYLELVFSDNGIGFDQQYADQIFDIFQRLHSGSEYAGTGIGLALCKKIVENHNGWMRVESEQGKGTVFYVYLPEGGEQKESVDESQSGITSVA